ncbi:MAG TPA: hypothetical protein VFA75_08050 [Nevskia sp.]|nr:hypothetical protein [Nevskia sp.]
MFRFLSRVRDQFRQDEIGFYELPFPGFVTDTRSSPVEVRFELDLRNDRNRAAWSQRWRTRAFEEGRYGAQPVEETVSARRAAAGKTQRPFAAAEPAAAPAKVVRMGGSLAA